MKKILNGLSAIALSTALGCASLDEGKIISLGYLERKGELKRVEIDNYVGSNEALDEMLNFYKGRYAFKSFDVLDENGNVVGRFVHGRMEGLHYRKFATDEIYLIDGNVTKDNLPNNYKLKQFN